MSTIRKIIILIITLASMNTLGDIKSKQEISSEAKSKAPHISSQQLAGYLPDKGDIILLDIRTEAEFQAGHIQGAKWFPRGNLELSVRTHKRPEFKNCSLLSLWWQIHTSHPYHEKYGLYQCG